MCYNGSKEVKTLFFRCETVKGGPYAARILYRLLFDHYVEAYNTYDLRDKARVGARLHAAKIPYRVRYGAQAGPCARRGG